MQKKRLGWMVMLLVCLLLAGCGSQTKDKNNEGTDSSKASSANNEDMLERVKEKGVLVLGTSADFAPFEFHAMVDGKDKVVGADIQLAQAMADHLGVKLKIMDMEFSSLLSAMQQGKVDIILSGMSATPEREKAVDFSTPYYDPPQSVIVKKENADKFTTIESLEGKKVGVQKGSIQEEIRKEQFPKSTPIVLAKIPNLIMEVNSGSADAAIIEKTIAEAYLKVNPDLTFSEIIPESKEGVAFAAAMPKNSGDFKTEINKVIEKLMNDGSIDRFVQEGVELSSQANEK